jgi:hypothetical protein
VKIIYYLFSAYFVGLCSFPRHKKHSNGFEINVAIVKGRPHGAQIHLKQKSQDTASAPVVSIPQIKQSKNTGNDFLKIWC